MFHHGDGVPIRFVHECRGDLHDFHRVHAEPLRKTRSWGYGAANDFFSFLVWGSHPGTHIRIQVPSESNSDKYKIIDLSLHRCDKSVFAPTRLLVDNADWTRKMPQKQQRVQIRWAKYCRAARRLWSTKTRTSAQNQPQKEWRKAITTHPPRRWPLAGSPAMAQQMGPNLLQAPSNVTTKTKAKARATPYIYKVQPLSLEKILHTANEKQSIRTILLWRAWRRCVRCVVQDGGESQGVWCDASPRLRVDDIRGC